ncbi:hypothetical protein PENSPDRAFT_650465 [Peniophora sp. CONT]|nr:hypothetical protein PENSPDRAFT_650465 [Peniophora sp. CONT]
MIASTSTSVHKASLVDPSTHSPALLELVEQPITRPVVDYLVRHVEEIVDFALDRPSKRGRSSKRGGQNDFATLVHNVLHRAEVEFPTILVTLAYLDRARPHLQIALEEWANERVFLGALVVASKYTNDSTLKNVHWAMCTSIFGKRDIGRIEREFLAVLDWELSISEADVLSHHVQLSEVLPELHPVSAATTAPLPSPLASTSSSTSSSPCPALQHSPASTAASFSPRTPPTLVDEVQVDFPTSSRSTSRENSSAEEVAKAEPPHKHARSNSLKRIFNHFLHHHSHSRAPVVTA